MKLYLFTSFLALFCSCTTCGKPIIQEKNYLINTSKDVSYINQNTQEYSINNNYSYTMSHYLVESPDTFEAWVNVPVNSLGGVICGNRYATNGTVGNVNWEVDYLGRITVLWNNKTRYEFKSKTINDGLWHHVAVVRDKINYKFRCYIDGVLTDTLKGREDDSICNFPLSVGIDKATWSRAKNPFDGSIREIAIYSNKLEDSQILDDYNIGKNNGKGVTGGSSLIGDWYFGEHWNQHYVYNSVDNGYDFYLTSFEKYVDLAPVDEFDYSIGILPDIQTLVDFPKNDWETKNNFQRMMGWIRDNHKSEKMKFLMHTGDIVDDGDSDLQWSRARAGYDSLNSELPYSNVLGNHDYDTNSADTREASYFNRYFPVEDMKNAFPNNFGGVMEEGKLDNSYYTFNACGIDYLVINLELFPRMATIRWASRLCEMFPEHRVIVVTHSYLVTDGTVSSNKGEDYGMRKVEEVQSGKELFEGVVKRYKNVFMTISGHRCNDDITLSEQIGLNGNRIYNIQIDTQCSNMNRQVTWTQDPLDTFLILKFNENKKEMYFRYYSPKYNKAWNIQNQFTVDFSGFEG